ncbi:MAG TPA: cupredoxin domain-containing protein [Rhizomicrobium sp.]|nr:cupredoxin domain-containing protein [Rhizomicrobium sp.]
MIPRTMTYAMFAAFLAAAPLPALAADAAVVMKNFDFAPMAITVSPGTTVTWTNQDGEPHTVVSADGLFRSAALDQNDSFKFTFSKPGVYKYVCSIHPKMMATVTVK